MDDHCIQRKKGLVVLILPKYIYYTVIGYNFEIRFELLVFFLFTRNGEVEECVRYA